MTQRTNDDDISHEVKKRFWGSFFSSMGSFSFWLIAGALVLGVLFWGYQKYVADPIDSIISIPEKTMGWASEKSGNFVCRVSFKCEMQGGKRVVIEDVQEAEQLSEPESTTNTLVDVSVELNEPTRWESIKSWRPSWLKKDE